MPDSFDEHVKLMFDLQALAFQADVTRVFSFKMGRDASSRVYPESGVAKGFHPSSHHGNRPAAVTEFAQINRYHVSLLPYFLDKLAAIQEGDQTLLDKSLIIYGSPMGDGNVHNHKRCPLVLLGGANGQLPGNVHHRAEARDADGQRAAERDAHGRARRRAAVRRLDREVLALIVRRRTVAMIRRRLETAAALTVLLLASHGVGLRARAAEAPVAAAAMREDLTEVRALMSRGADVNAAQGDGMTALHWAAERGNAELTALLLTVGRPGHGDDPARQLHAAPSRRPSRPRRRRAGADHGRGRRVGHRRRPA